MKGLDTCAIIDFIRGCDSLKNVLEHHTDIVTNDYTYLEVLQGAKQKQPYEDFFTRIESFPLTKKTFALAVQLKEESLRKGTEIPMHDCIIAASFIEHNVRTIITRDKHFTHIKALKVISY